jgi:putative transposase
MPSTYVSHYYHIVFSTKNREPIIAAPWRGKLHGYFRGIVEGLGGECEIVGGTDDHIHLLVRLSATHRVADFVRELKKASSMWVRRDMAQRGFTWQEGYASFTVSASAADEVRRYIDNQEKHHQKRSFREELVILLRRSGVKFDERHLD